MGAPALTLPNRTLFLSTMFLLRGSGRPPMPRTAEMPVRATTPPGAALCPPHGPRPTPVHSMTTSGDISRSRADPRGSRAESLTGPASARYRRCPPHASRAHMRGSEGGQQANRPGARNQGRRGGPAVLQEMHRGADLGDDGSRLEGHRVAEPSVDDLTANSVRSVHSCA